MSRQLRSLLRKVNIDKALATTGFLSVFVALIVISRTPPATGYELSIYYAYPAYFGFLIIASSACGIGILLHQAFAAQKSNWWLAGLCLVIFSNSVFLGLPFFRGYAFFPHGDTMSHVGMMKDIVATGHIGETNFYPVVHLLGVSLRDITGLGYAAVTNLLFVFFSMVYLFNIYLLASVVANHRGQALLITAFACPLIFSYLHGGVFPSILSIFMLPLLLYFYHRRQKIPSEQVATILLLILLTLLITACHPVTAIFAIGAVLALNLGRVLYGRIARRKGLVPQTSRGTVKDYIAPLTSLAIFLIWILPNPLILKRLGQILNFLTGSGIMPPFVRLEETLGQAGLTTYQTIELFIFRYGAIFMYGIIAGIAVLIVLRMSLSRKARTDPLHFSYAVLFVVGLGASVLSLFGYTGETGPERISRFFLIVAPVVSGLVLYDLITKQRPSNSGSLTPGRKPLIAITVILILVAVVLSTFNAYNSPRVMKTNAQVTRMEIAGPAWFGSHRVKSIAIATARLALGRYDDFNFGIESATFPRAKRYPPPIPSHFGYDKNSSIAETFDFQDSYLLTSERSRMSGMHVPANVRPRVPQYTEDDFARLRADPAASQIYANSEFEVWLVYGARS